MSDTIPTSVNETPPPGPCEVCWTVSWEPTPEGVRCNCCWLHEQWDAVRTERDALEVLLAWEAGELTDGQACALLNLDHIAARELKQQAIAAACKRWAAWRERNPPKAT